MPTHWDTNSEPIPGYRLLQRIGRGGYGEVWKAEAPGGILKAVKLVYGELGSDYESNQQAEREFRALHQIREIRHTFVLSLDRFDVVNGQLIIVTELAECDLSRRLFECRDQGLPGIPRDELLGYLAEAAEALDALNERYQMQHLDVKPQNLFLLGGHVKVADFGLVKVFEGRSAVFTGGITPIYACPESFDGWVSRTSDQYSLAIVFMEMLTGRLPFPGPSPRQFMFQHLTHAPDLSVLSEEDRAVVRRAMSKNPDARYSSCREFVEALPKTPVPPAAPPESAVPVREAAITMSPSDSTAWTLFSPLKTDPRFVGGVAAGPTDLTQSQVAALVVGAGRTGVDCLKRIAECFPVRALEAAHAASVCLIGVDTCHGGLDLPEPTSDGVRTIALHCPLGKGNDYLRNWERHSHLKSWLNPNCLFQVANDGSANGRRALGRLAFIDNHQRIADAVAGELSRLKLSSVTGSIRLRVFIVANMAGGTGSGMFLDLCYLVRRLLRDHGFDDAEVDGVLVSEPSKRNESQDAINQWALAEELDELCQAKTTFETTLEPGKEPECFACPPVHQLYLCSSGAQNLKIDPGELVSEFIATCVVHRLYQRDGKSPSPVIRSLGWTQVEYPEQRMLESISQEFGKLLYRHWTGPINSRESAHLFEHAELCLRQAGFDSDSVMRLLQGHVDALLETPLHVELVQQLQALENSLSFDDLSSTATAFEATLQQISDSIGSDWDSEPDPRQTPLRKVSQQAVDRAYQELASSVTQATVAALNGAGARWSRAHVILEGMGDFFLRVLDRSHQQLRAERQALSRQARSIHDYVERFRTAGGVGSRHVAQTLADVERYGRAKIFLRLREMAVQVYLRLRNKIVHLQEHLGRIRQELDRWHAGMQEEVRPLESSAVTQLLFPRKHSRWTDARQDLLDRLGNSDQVAQLDRYVDLKTLAPLGGLWEIAAMESGEEVSFLPIDAAIQQWLTAHLPAVDASQCLLELHGGDPSRLTKTLQQFFEWAVPGSPRSGQNVDEYRLVMVSPGHAGDAVVGALNTLDWSRNCTLVRCSSRCVFSRSRTGGSLQELLPSWLVRHRDLYLQRRQGRTSPRVLPFPGSTIPQ